MANSDWTAFFTDFAAIDKTADCNSKKAQKINIFIHNFFSYSLIGPLENLPEKIYVKGKDPRLSCEVTFVLSGIEQEGNDNKVYTNKS